MIGRIITALLLYGDPRPRSRRWGDCWRAAGNLAARSAPSGDEPEETR